MTKYRPRWSDNDRNWGPFTYARDVFYKSKAIILRSSKGEEGDDDGCNLRISCFGHTLLIWLPPIIPSYRTKVYPSWDEATVDRLGRNWYWDIDRREFGFNYSDGFLQVFLGRQTGDSSTTRSWSKFMPWTQWRSIRTTFYGLSGEIVAEIDETLPEMKGGFKSYEKKREIKDRVPTVCFNFYDFDGEEITASTLIEEHESHIGHGKWRWLSWFTKPKIWRSLDIRFTKEMGRRKGSWKGGTVGHSISMLPGELHKDAWKRYCVEHDLDKNRFKLFFR